MNETPDLTKTNADESAARGKRATKHYTAKLLDLTSVGDPKPHRDPVQAASLICDVLAYADTLPGESAQDVLELADYHRTDLDGAPRINLPPTLDTATLDRIAALARSHGDCGSDFIGEVCNLVAMTGRSVDPEPEPEPEYECADIARVECLVCGTVETGPSAAVDMWNGYGDCPKYGTGDPGDEYRALIDAHDAQRHLTRWTHKSGRVVVLASDEHGAPETIADTDPEPDPGPATRWPATTLAALRARNARRTDPFA